MIRNSNLGMNATLRANASSNSKCTFKLNAAVAIVLGLIIALEAGGDANVFEARSEPSG